MSRSKQKGTAAETAVVRALHSLGFPYAERRALRGGKDLGDVTGTPGLIWEVKDARTWCGPEWLRETETERVNANADFGILVVKVPGIGAPNAGLWITAMEQDAAELLIAYAWRERMLKPGARIAPHPIGRYPTGPLSLQKASEYLDGMDARGGALMQVEVRGRGDNPPFSLMRLSTRCRLLVEAGYGATITEPTRMSNIVKEC